MKNICIVILLAFISSIILSGCEQKTKANMIQSKRRFAQYSEPQQQSQSGVVDLSEGPRLNYDAKFGPQKLNFDIKIVDPY